MCEVEFWEVFYYKVLRYFRVVTFSPLVGCQIANRGFAL